MTLHQFIKEYQEEIDAHLQAEGDRCNARSRLNAVHTTKWIWDLATEAGVKFPEPFQGDTP